MTLFVDHCHDKKKVRGMLCNNCNTGLGYFKDDTTRLQRAIDYLNGKTIPLVGSCGASKTE